MISTQNKGKIAYDTALNRAGVSITMSSEAQSYEVESLYDETLATKARTTGITAEEINFDLGAAYNIKAIYYQGCNIVSGDTLYTIQAGTTAAATDYGPLALTKAAKALIPIDQTYRYWKVKATKASGSYIEWEKFDLLLQYYVFDENFNQKRKCGLDEKYIESVDDYGNTINYNTSQLQAIDWEFQHISKEQRDEFKTAATFSEVITFDPGEQEAYCGRLRISRPEIDFVERYDLNFTFREKR